MVNYELYNDHYELEMVNAELCNDHFELEMVDAELRHDHYELEMVNAELCNGHSELQKVNLFYFQLHYELRIVHLETQMDKPKKSTFTITKLPTFGRKAFIRKILGRLQKIRVQDPCSLFYWWKAAHRTINRLQYK